MQFHFEADSEVVEAWLTEFRDVVEMRRPGWLERYPELAAQHAAGTERAGLALARAFVRSILRDDRTGSNRLTPAILAT
jgi:GMP synthase (glutamine-hydrolysing)